MKISPIRVISVPLLASFLFLISCSNDPDRKKLQFQVASKNAMNEKAEMTVNADTVDRVLEIEFNIQKPGNIPFPSNGKDTLTNTSFRVEFLCEGKPISLNSISTLCFQRIGCKIPEGINSLTFHTDTFSLFQKVPIKIMLPFYFFSALPSGSLKDMQVRIYQDEFFSEEKRSKKINPNIETIHEAQSDNHTWDSIEVKYREKLSLRIFDVQLAFKMQIPKVYSADLICTQIVLQNDSVWNPGGSDFTLFRSSYPDLYFETRFPDMFVMNSSQVQKSTAEWNLGDTSQILYYSESDSFRISVLDWDKFSHDDVIESGICSVARLKDAAKTPMSFGHVIKFEASLQNVKARN